MNDKPLTREQFAAETTEQTIARVMAEQSSFLKPSSKAPEQPISTPEQYIEKLRRVIPAEMQAERRWTQCFQVAKATPGMSGKVPCSSHSDPNTWLTFDEVCHSAFKMVDGVWVREEDAPLRPGRGIGFHFLNSEYLPIDIDHVRNKTTGHWCSEAKILVSKLQTYTEWSVSGTGLHCIGLGKIRQKQVGTQHLQFWNGRLGVPRYFWLTGNVPDELGDDFTRVRECAEEFQMYASHPRIYSVKMQEELRKIDPEQAASLPPEIAASTDEQPREKVKAKTRKVVSGFDIEDYLKFYGFKVINRAKNEVGECYRVDWCPWKGGPHAGHNDTTCNFICPTSDGGLGFKCHSTGCCDESIHSVIKKLAEGERGPYPGTIYEEKNKKEEYRITLSSKTYDVISDEALQWLIEDYLPLASEVYLFAPKGRGKTKVCDYFNVLVNNIGKRVLRFNLEDMPSQILKPGLHAAGGNLKLTEWMQPNAAASKDGKEYPTRIDFSQEPHVNALKDYILSFGDVGLVIIEPINNYKGKAKAISEDDMRPIHMNLAQCALDCNVCILVVSHTNRKKDVDVLEKSHGAGSGPNVARVNLFLDKNPNDLEECVLTDAGSNVKVGPSKVFKIVEQPPFDLGGITHKKIAIAVFDRHDNTISAQEMLEDTESTKQSQARDIGMWLVEYLTGKGDVRKDVVLGAAKQFNKDWSEDNISKVFNRRMKKQGTQSRTEGGGKNKITYWSLGKKEQAAMVFDGGTPSGGEQYVQTSVSSETPITQSQ